MAKAKKVENETPLLKPTREVIIAAAVALLAKQKGDIDTGRYDLSNTSLTIDLDGSALKSADYETTPTRNIPMIPTLCILLKKAGVVGNNIVDQIMEAIEEALIAEEKGDEYVKGLLKEYAVAEEKIRAKLAALPKTVANGSFTTKGSEMKALTIEGVEAPAPVLPPVPLEMVEA